MKPKVAHGSIPAGEKYQYSIDKLSKEKTMFLADEMFERNQSLIRVFIICAGRKWKFFILKNNHLLTFDFVDCINYHPMV